MQLIVQLAALRYPRPAQPRAVGARQSPCRESTCTTLGALVPEPRLNLAYPIYKLKPANNIDFNILVTSNNKRNIAHDSGKM